MFLNIFSQKFRSCSKKSSFCDTTRNAVGNSHYNECLSCIVITAFSTSPGRITTRANGIKPSMSAVGCPYDNACAENFFSLLKTECIYRAQPQTFEETGALIDEYIYLCLSANEK